MSNKPLSFRFIITATLLGNTLEWYDFATFGLLAPIFKELFFPREDPWFSVFYTMVLFFCGSILRPVGGILFGYIGDRYGRKVALLASVLLLAIPTFATGLIPTYAQIGILATILLAIMRLFQGIAIGGEFPGVITFLIESSPPKSRIFFGSFAFFGVAVGIFLGGLDFFLFTIHASIEAFFQWGWRLLYIIGSLLGCLSFFLRRKLHETPSFQGIRQSHEILSHPIKILFLKYKKNLLKLMGIEILETLGFNLTISFLLIYLTGILHIPLMEAILLNLIFLSLLVIFVPISGYIASRIGAKKQAVCGALAYFLLILPIFWFFSQPHLRILAPFGLAILLALYMGPMPALYCGFFPTKVRLSGLGFGFNLVVAIIGGLAPLLAIGFIRYTGLTIAPAFFLMAGALIALVTLRFIKSEDL